MTNKTQTFAAGRTNSNPVDIHVGRRVRLRRTLLGISQEKLGAALGLTFQQVQKYERGTNRIGASRLFDLARILDVPVNYFFDDMPEDTAQRSPAQTHQTASHFVFGEFDTLAKREILELVRGYSRISDPRIRKNIYELIKSLSPDSNAQDPDTSLNSQVTEIASVHS